LREFQRELRNSGHSINGLLAAGKEKELDGLNVDNADMLEFGGAPITKMNWTKCDEV
jgi:hypothetical protein